VPVSAISLSGIVVDFVWGGCTGGKDVGRRRPECVVEMVLNLGSEGCGGGCGIWDAKGIGDPCYEEMETDE